MRRRPILLVLALAVLIGGGFVVYTCFFQVKQLGDSPRYIDDKKPLPPPDEFAELARTDPITMFQKCLSRYQREIKGGFRAVLEKREWVGGELHPQEVIRLAAAGEFPETGEQPRVRMIWDKGAREDGVLGFKYPIRGTLFVEGQNRNQILVWRPQARITEYSVAVNDAAARKASRYCIRDAGLYRSMLRTYEVWKEHRDAGDLKTEFLGKQPVAELGNRTCYVIRRTCTTPELDAFELGGQPDPKLTDQDRFNEVTIMIDAERWLQVGTVLRRTDANPPRLIGEYYFRDVELNPVFPPNTFTVEGMKADADKK